MTTILTCPICKSSEFSIVYDHLPSLLDEQVIKECKNCQFAFQNPQIKNVDQTIANEDYVIKDDLGLATKLGHIKSDGTLDEIANDKFWDIRILNYLTKFRKTNTICDIGCGLGFFLASAKNQGWNAIGLDYAPEKIRYAKEHYGITIFSELPKDVGPADGAILCNVVEHVSDPREIIKYSAGLCREGGCVFIETPNYDSFTRRHLGKLWSDFALNHISFFLTSHLIRACEDHGLKLDSLEIGGILLGDTENLISDEQRRDIQNHYKSARQKGKMEAGSAIFAFFTKSKGTKLEVLDIYSAFRIDGEILSPITKTNKITQTFTSDNDNLCRIDIQFGTFLGKSKCNAIILLEEYDEGSIEYVPIKRITVDMSQCIDNEFLPIRFEPVINSARKQYRLTIYSDTIEKDRGFALRFDPSVVRNFELKSTNKKIIGTLMFATYFLTSQLPDTAGYGIKANSRPKEINKKIITVENL